jgi:hypothetical protein
MDPTEDTFDSQSGSSHAPDLGATASPIIIDDEPEERPTTFLGYYPIADR